jgi:hypothetical protein
MQLEGNADSSKIVSFGKEHHGNMRRTGRRGGEHFIFRGQKQAFRLICALRPWPVILEMT